jgi:hypothetical protein
LYSTDTRPENPTEMHTRILANKAWPTLGRPSKRQMVSVGIVFAFILGYLRMLAFSVAGGVAATATFARMEGLPYSRELLGNGAIGVLVLTAIFHVQYGLVAFSSYNRLRRYWRRRSGGLKWATQHFGLLILPLQFGLSFARTLLTALILMSRFHNRSKPLNLNWVQERADVLPRFSADIYWRNGRCISPSIRCTVHVSL